MRRSNDDRVELSDENGTSNLLTDNPKSEYVDVLPEELSGDQNGQQSIFASSVEGAKANFVLTVTTIIKTVIGSGILALPFTISKMGYIFGLMVFAFAAWLNQFGSILLLKAKNLSYHSNYATIFYEIWKSKLAKGLGSLLIFLNNIGICIAEMIIFKKSFRKIFSDVITDTEVLDQFYTTEIFFVLVIAIMETPLTLVSKMEKLKFMAMLGVGGIVIFILTFVFFFITVSIDDNPANNPAGSMSMFPDNWFQAAAAVPNVLLALSFQMNLFPIYKGMRNVTDSKMAKATLVGIIFCCISYLVVGIMGYDYVGHKVSANFLESLSYDKIQKPFFFILNFSFLLSVFFAFPIMFFGGRNNFIALMKLLLLKQDKKQKGWRTGDQVEEISTYIQDQTRSERKRKAKLHFIIYTVIIYLVIIGVALGVEDIEAVFNVVGAICSTSIAVLLPCFFYFKLIVLKKQQKSIKYYVSIVLFCVMAPYALFSVAALYVKPE